jgi:hypothetical protein
MRDKSPLNETTLKTVCAKLGDGWRYHAVMTANDRRGHHFLSNQAGLFIEVCYAYGAELPQWKLQISHPSKHYAVTIATIGCSLKKSLSAISADIKARLLSHSADAYNKLRELTDEHQANVTKSENKRFMMEALQRVMPLARFYHGGAKEAHEIKSTTDDRRVGVIYENYRRQDFELRLYEVSAEQLIEIYQIINR